MSDILETPALHKLKPVKATPESLADGFLRQAGACDAAGKISWQ
jgi:hypothetical protein